MSDSTKISKGYRVRGETNTLELAQVGHAINLRVYSGGTVVGRLRIGQGGMQWFPKGTVKPRKIDWHDFAFVMHDWPLIDTGRGSLKLQRTAMTWYPEGKTKGRGGTKLPWRKVADLVATLSKKTTDSKELSSKLSKKASRIGRQISKKAPAKAGKKVKPKADSVA